MPWPTDWTTTLTPVVRRILESARPEVAAALGPVQRLAMDSVYPDLLANAPHFAQVFITTVNSICDSPDTLLREFLADPTYTTLVRKFIPPFRSALLDERDAILANTPGIINRAIMNNILNHAIKHPHDLLLRLTQHIVQQDCGSPGS